MESGKKIAYIGIGLFICFVIFMHNRHNNIITEIKENGTYSMGRIYNINIAIHKGSKRVAAYYKFMSTKGEEVRGSISLTITRSYSSPMELKGKIFPVVYSRLDVEKNYMLIFQEDFEKYGFMYPDSLSWVERSFPLNR